MVLDTPETLLSDRFGGTAWKEETLAISSEGASRINPGAALLAALYGEFRDQTLPSSVSLSDRLCRRRFFQTGSHSDGLEALIPAEVKPRGRDESPKFFRSIASSSGEAVFAIL
jgi:hypothetical protein